jgi:hypothetical protein
MGPGRMTLRAERPWIRAPGRDHARRRLEAMHPNLAGRTVAGTAWWFHTRTACPGLRCGRLSAPGLSPLVAEAFRRTARPESIRLPSFGPVDDMRQRPKFPGPDRKCVPRPSPGEVVLAKDQTWPGSTIESRPLLPRRETPDPRHRKTGSSVAPMYALPCHPPSWQVEPISGWKALRATETAPPPAAPPGGLRARMSVAPLLPGPARTNAPPNCWQPSRRMACRRRRPRIAHPPLPNDRLGRATGQGAISGGFGTLRRAAMPSAGRIVQRCPKYAHCWTSGKSPGTAIGCRTRNGNDSRGRRVQVPSNLFPRTSSPEAHPHAAVSPVGRWSDVLGVRSCCGLAWPARGRRASHPATEYLVSATSDDVGRG